jgi:protein TonB
MRAAAAEAGALARLDWDMTQRIGVLVAAMLVAQCATRGVSSQPAGAMRAEESAADAAVPLPYGVFREFEPGVVSPILVSSTPPQYPPTALHAKVRGSVILRAVVDQTGRVATVQVLKPLEASVDAAASQALARWQFKPGTRDGEPVSVAIVVRMAFSTQ